MDQLPLAPNCKVLLNHPCGILVLEKAPGILTHPNPKPKSISNKSKTSLLEAEYDYEGEFYHWGNFERLYLTHRLDSPTSGVIIATTELKLAEEIKKKFKSGKIQKVYHAIVFPKAPIQRGIWRDSLVEKKINGKLRVIRHHTGITAKTHCSLVESRTCRSMMMLKLIPITGRTHQLRVQAALRNQPIVGDKNYGDFKLNRKIHKDFKINRLLLHATEIKMEIEGKTIIAKSSIPEEFTELININ